MFKKDVKIYTYNPYSAAAKHLANALGVARFRTASEFVCGPEHMVINWGSTKVPSNIVQAGTILNHPSVVRRVSNKLSFFEDVKAGGPRIPEYTRSAVDAMKWVKDGNEVLGRAKLSGKGGDGIIFGSDRNTFEDFLDCQLFVMYKRKKDEYRVHFFKDKMIDVQQKMLRKHDDQGNPVDPKTVDFRIRNLNNGFIFARNDIKPPADVIKQAELAFKASGLDFGAIDVIYNSKEERAYVLEINTAPGMMGTTLDKYTEAFTEYFRSAA